MKKIIILALMLTSSVSFAQTTNTPPAVTTTTLTVNAAPAETSAYYRLIYNPTTKKVVALVYSTGITQTIYPIYTGAATYAQAQAYCSTNSLTGLPPQKAGQP